MYLTIDSNNPDYQFIHVDLGKNYCVAAKLKFNKSQDTGEEFFSITHAYVVRPGFDGPTYQAIKSFNAYAQADSNAPYKFVLNVDLSNDPTRIPGELRNDCINNKFIRKTTATPTKENIIDLHIEKHPLNKDVDIASDYGQGWCKFYII